MAPAEGVVFDVHHAPVCKGRGTPGALITIDEGAVSGGWNKVGTATVDDNGDWSFTGGKLPEGLREVRAVQSNGGTGFARNRFTVKREVKKPVTLTFPVEGGAFDTLHAPVYRGRGTPGALITIQKCRPGGPWYQVGTTRVNTSGDWSYIGLALPASVREARALQGTDGTVARKTTFTVMREVNIPVTLTSPANRSSFNDSCPPLYSGKGAPGASITIQQVRPGSSWYVVGQATVDTQGDWSYVGLPLPASNREARALQNSNGTVSAKSNFIVTPTAQVDVVLKNPVEGASFDESHIPVYSGTGMPGALIFIEQRPEGDTLKIVGITTVNADGRWRFTGLALTAGRWQALATQYFKGVASTDRKRFVVEP